jgi:hypothetical protein
MTEIIQEIGYVFLIGMFIVGVIGVLMLPEEFKNQKIRRLEELERMESRKNDEREYLSKIRDEFVEAVSTFEKTVPTEYWSVWYFLRWSKSGYEQWLDWILFEEWLEGNILYEFTGVYGQEISNYKRGIFDVVDQEKSDLLNKLKYPKYVKKDVETAAILSESEDYLLRNFSDMISFFDGKYEKNEFLWKLNAERKKKIELEEEEKDRIRKELDL